MNVTIEPSGDLLVFALDPRRIEADRQAKKRLDEWLDRVSPASRIDVEGALLGCRNDGNILLAACGLAQDDESRHLVHLSRHPQLSRHAMDAMRDAVFSTLPDDASWQWTSKALIELPAKPSAILRKHLQRWQDELADRRLPDVSMLSAAFQLHAQSGHSAGWWRDRLVEWAKSVALDGGIQEGEWRDIEQGLRKMSLMGRAWHKNVQASAWFYTMPSPNAKAGPSLTLSLAVDLPRLQRWVALSIEGDATVTEGFTGVNDSVDFVSFHPKAAMLRARQSGKNQDMPLRDAVVPLSVNFLSGCEGMDAPPKEALGLAKSTSTGVAMDDAPPDAVARAVCAAAVAANTSSYIRGSLTLSNELAQVKRDAANAARKAQATTAALRARFNARIANLEIALDRARSRPGASTAPNQPTDAALRDLEKANNALLAQAEHLRSRYEQMAHLARQLREERDSLRSEMWQAKQSDAEPKQSTGSEAKDPTASLQRLDTLGEWCEQHLSKRVFLTKRALRAAAKSVHGDPQLIARCLLALDRWFAPMQFDGSAAAREAWLAFVAREHLRDGPVGTAPDNHRTWDSYRITFQGRRLTLDRHLQGSSSRDITRTFRVYYTVDKESSGTIVVGHLPEHLPNSLT